VTGPGHQPSRGKIAPLPDVVTMVARLPWAMFSLGISLVQQSLNGMARLATGSPGGPASTTSPPGPTTDMERPATARGPQSDHWPKERIMADTHLDDDHVKLVEYTIVSIERDDEKLLSEPKQVIEADALSGNAFTNKVIAAWINNGGKNKKYQPESLEVYYNVLARWPKKSGRYEKRQVEQLQAIEQAILKSKSSK
jgi:hypothetical protein